VQERRLRRQQRRGEEPDPGPATGTQQLGIDGNEASGAADGSTPALVEEDILEEENDDDLMEDEDDICDDKMLDGTQVMSLMCNDAMQGILTLNVGLGGRRGRNRGALVRIHWAVVSEVYSPQRAAQAAAILADLEIDPGLSLDIATCDENGDP